MEKEYAQAMLAVAQKGLDPKDLFQRLEKTLRARGHLALLPKIALALREEEKRMRRGAESVLSVAKESDIASAKAESAAYTEGAPVRVVTDDSLIGGWTLSTPNTRVDASFKKQLLNLYQKITA